MKTSANSFTACHDCDLLIARASLQKGQSLNCPRCHAKLFHARLNPIERGLALAITSLILFLPANLLPILSLSIFGQQQSETILQSVLSLYDGGLAIVAAVVLIFAVLIPGLQILLLTYITACLQLKSTGRYLRQGLNLYQLLHGWGMLEIYLIGTLIAVIKLKDIANLEPGLGLYCLAGLILTTCLTNTLFDTQQAWQVLKHRQKVSRSISGQIQQ